MKRFEDWQSRLSEYLESRRQARYQFGQHDCALFVAGAVMAMTGTDIAGPLRNGYQSLTEALECIRPGAHLLTATRILTSAHSLPEVPKLQAQRGDIVLLHIHHLETLGIVSLNGLLAAASDPGWLEFPGHLALKAWRV